MSPLLFTVWMVAVGIAAWVLTGLVRRYALVTGMLDVPGARSSHAAPVPRGGGIAIVLAFLGGSLLGNELPRPLVMVLVGAGLPVAAIGLVDDRRSVAARWRLSVHLMAAAWAWAWLGSDVAWPAALQGVLPWPVGATVGVLGLAWLLNLFNFMDGIDGLAALQAVFVCLGGACLAWLAGTPHAGRMPLLLAAASAGFLLWNWPPARIFMGDVGSGFLGLMLGVLALDAARLRPELLWGWAALLAVFVADASVTVLRRAWRGERVAMAHRTHAYQRLARRWGGHRPVTVLVGVINLLWLLPLALATVRWPAAAAALTALAYTPLLIGVWCLGAGSEEDGAGAR